MKYELTDAMFSEDRIYRYSLTRIWKRDLPYIAWVCLNPSTADEKKDDPTIRRCVEFSSRWGFGGMNLYNLFALRSTDPKILYRHLHPIGEENNAYLNAIPDTTRIICAWGSHGSFKNRGVNVLQYVLHPENRFCLRKTKEGLPGHPLYLRYNVALISI